MAEGCAGQTQRLLGCRHSASPVFAILAFICCGFCFNFFRQFWSLLCHNSYKAARLCLLGLGGIVTFEYIHRVPNYYVNDIFSDFPK